MDDLFGSDSENSDGEMKISSQPGELPSTQEHMEDLFGESDDDNGKQQQSPSYEKPDDDSDGEYKTPPQSEDEMAQRSSIPLNRDARNDKTTHSSGEDENSGMKSQSDDEERISDDDVQGNQDQPDPVQHESDDNVQHRQGESTPLQDESDLHQGEGTPLQDEGTPLQDESDDGSHPKEGGHVSDDDNVQHRGKGTPLQDESDDDIQHKEGGHVPVQHESDDDVVQHQQSEGTPLQDESDDDIQDKQGGHVPVQHESDEDNVLHQGTPLQDESDDDHVQRHQSGGTPLQDESDDDNGLKDQSDVVMPIQHKDEEVHDDIKKDGGSTPLQDESDDDNSMQMDVHGASGKESDTVAHDVLPQHSDDDEDSDNEMSKIDTQIFTGESNKGNESVSPPDDDQLNKEKNDKQLGDMSPDQEFGEVLEGKQSESISSSEELGIKNDVRPGDSPQEDNLDDDEAFFKEMAEGDEESDEEGNIMDTGKKRETDDAIVKEVDDDPGDSDEGEILGKRKLKGKEDNADDEAFFKEMAEDDENSEEDDNIKDTGKEKETDDRKVKGEDDDDDAFFKEMADDNEDGEEGSRKDTGEKVDSVNSFFNEIGDDDSDEDEVIGRRKMKETMGEDDDQNSADEMMQVDEGDNEDNVERILPTQQDLFGEDLDVSSDEEDEPEEVAHKKPMIDDDDDEDDAGKQVPESFDERGGDQDEQPPSPEKEEEGLSISIELPRCNISLGKELYFIKLPNFLSVDTKPFDPNFYEDEIDEDEVIDEEGKARLKLKVENTIRWRYSKDKDGNEIKESNCRFVRWSDGSITMHLGNEVFDVFKMPIEGEQNHLFVQQGTGLQAQAVFKNKLSFRPQSTSSQTHQKMILSIADRMSKAQKIKMMPATDKDPENQRESLLKKEEFNLRAQCRREAIQRRQREKNAHKSQLNTNYLEQDMADEEDDLDTSLAAIKNRYKQDKQGKSTYDQIYSSDEDGDSDEETKAKKVKLDSSSDEENIKQDAKKKTKKVIEESDDDDGGSDDDDDDDGPRKKASKATVDSDDEDDDDEPKKKVGKAILDSDDDDEDDDTESKKKANKAILDSDDDDDDDTGPNKKANKAILDSDGDDDDGGDDEPKKKPNKAILDSDDDNDDDDRPKKKANKAILDSDDDDDADDGKPNEGEKKAAEESDDDNVENEPMKKSKAMIDSSDESD